MGQEGDDRLSLPVPPPPRPAARREAIDAALRKFDGIEEPPAKRQRSPIRWAAMHRRPAGALVAAAIIAVISIPAIQITLRDGPSTEVSETREPPAGLPAVANEPEPAADAPEAVAAENAVPEKSSPPSAILADQRREQTARDSAQKAIAAPASVGFAPAPPPIVAAAPPPPPPPAPVLRQAPAEPEALAEAADSGDNIVVTGSRVRRSNLESASPVTAVAAEATDDHFVGFVARLQDLIDRNDRVGVARLVALPLRVTVAGQRRTYSSSRDIARDYDRIFTPAVRTSDLSPHNLQSRDGGRLRGNGRIWFGCLKTSCPSAESIRIREIHP